MAKQAVQLLQVVVPRGRKGRRGLRQGRVEGALELGPLQGTQEPRLKVRAMSSVGEKVSAGIRRKPSMEFPDTRALHTLGEEREPGRLQGLQVPAHGSEVLREVGGSGVRQRWSVAPCAAASRWRRRCTGG